MKMKHNVLVPVDGSQFSHQIIPHLRKFFPPEENEITLLRVGAPPTGRVGKPPRPAAINSTVAMYGTVHEMEEARHPIYASQEQASAVAELELGVLADEHELEAAGYTVHMVVRFKREKGPAIVNYINTHDIDIVAMTTHWRTGLDKLVHGSVAQYVAQHITIPITMVRPQVET